MPLLRGRNAPSAAEELRKQRKAFEEGDLRPAVRKKQEEAAESLRRRRSAGCCAEEAGESSGKPSEKAVC